MVSENTNSLLEDSIHEAEKKTSNYTGSSRRWQVKLNKLWKLLP